MIIFVRENKIIQLLIYFHLQNATHQCVIAIHDSLDRDLPHWCVSITKMRRVLLEVKFTTVITNLQIALPHGCLSRAFRLQVNEMVNKKQKIYEETTGQASPHCFLS